MRFAFVKCHGSGNDFALIDARAVTLDDRGWAAVARALGDRDGPVGSDGLLLLTAGGNGDHFGQRMFNPDGSESETCLNGLRCTARLGFEALGIYRGRARLIASTADVERVADLAPGVATVRTVAGPASTDPHAVGLRLAAPVIDVAVPGLPSRRSFTAVAMPNPHLVSFVEEIDERELIALGDWCEARPALLVDRANVSFVQVRGRDLYVRTYERGIGLTDACGSAMAASVFAAATTGRATFAETVTVFNAGGMVRAAAARDGWVSIEGNATFCWDGEIDIDLVTGCAGDLMVTRDRDAEAAAWAAVIAGLAD